MASEVKSDLRFEISDLILLCSNVYLIILFLKNDYSEEDEKEAKEDLLTCVLCHLEANFISSKVPRCFRKLKSLVCESSGEKMSRRRRRESATYRPARVLRRR